MKIVDSLIQRAIKIDGRVDQYIEEFLEPYILAVDPPYLSTLLPMFFEMVFYLLIILVPLSLIKVFYLGYRTYTYLLVFIVLLIGLALAGIFFAFLQLLYIV
jgi:hypothetical protein